MNKKWTTVLGCVLVLTLLATSTLGCTKKAEEEVIIRLGNITDLTGPAATACVPYSWAYEESLEYLNEEDPIPGVEVQLVTYDGKLEPARAVPGYDWLRARDVVAITCSLPQIADILPFFIERDQVPTFCGQPTSIMEACPLMFTLTATNAVQHRTITKWIGDQWANYPTKPKIGVVGWNTSYELTASPSIEDYCRAHPGKFEWVGSYLAPMGTVTWAGEVEKLKDCDYICACHGGGLGQATFMSEFRDKGYTAKFFAAEETAVWRSLLVDKVGYEALDGSLSFHGAGWWNDPYPVIDIAKELLYENHPADADDIVYSGYGYLSGVPQMFFLYYLLKETVERVGADNVDSHAVYDTAIDFRYTFEGFPEMGYTEGSRVSVKFGAVYEWSAEADDLVRISDWITVTE